MTLLLVVLLLLAVLGAISLHDLLWVLVIVLVVALALGVVRR